MHEQNKCMSLWLHFLANLTGDISLFAGKVIMIICNVNFNSDNLWQFHIIFWHDEKCMQLFCWNVRLYWESISMSFIQSLYLKWCLWLCCLLILIRSTSVQKKGHCVFATSPLVNPVISMNFGLVFQHLAVLWEIKKAHHICLVHRRSLSFNRKVLTYSEVDPASNLSH